MVAVGRAPVALLGVGVGRRRWRLRLGGGPRHKGGRVAVEGQAGRLDGGPGLGFCPFAGGVAAIA